MAKKPPLTEIEKLRKTKQEQSTSQLHHNRPLPYSAAPASMKVGPGSYVKKLNLIGQSRESDSMKGYGPLISKAERGLQDGIFSIVNPNDFARNSSDIRAITAP